MLPHPGPAAQLPRRQAVGKAERQRRPTRALALFLLPSAPARPPFFRPFASFVGLETGAPRAARGKAQRGEAVQALRLFRGAPAGVPGPRVCVHVHAHARTHTRL